MGELLTVKKDLLLLETLTEILEVYGHPFIQEGEERVDMFAKTDSELKLCDVDMSKTGGFEVLEKLKTLVGPSKLPPFIFLSAKTEQKNIQHALDLGAVDFVSKPYSATELLKLIDLWLRK